MKKIVLITVRDCYPFETVVLNGFETLFEYDIYDHCVKPLGVLSLEEEQMQRAKAIDYAQDPEIRIKKSSIGKLFRDEKACWTNNKDSDKGLTFEKYKKDGIPLLRKVMDSTRFYVAPCTGRMKMDDTLLRQKYTSECIDLICKIESVPRLAVLCIIHSLDTGAKTLGNESCLVTEDALQKGTPLDDIIDAGHLFMFHHTISQRVFDEIVMPICFGNNNELNLSLLDDLFPSINLKWWQEFSQLNSMQY